MAVLRVGHAATVVGILLGAKDVLSHDACTTESCDAAGQFVTEAASADMVFSAAKGSSVLQLARSWRSVPDNATTVSTRSNRSFLPERVYYINMNESASRREHMEESLADYPGQVERVAAVEPKDLIWFTEYYEGLLSRQMQNKPINSTDKDVIISIWLSHILLWERLSHELKAGEKALILEDDVQFPVDYQEQLNEVLAVAPEKWSVLKVCGWGNARVQDMVSSDSPWTRPTDPFFLDREDLNRMSERQNASLADLGIILDGSDFGNTDLPFYLGSCGYVVEGSTILNVLEKVRRLPVQDIDLAMEDNTLTGQRVKAYKLYELLPSRRVFRTGGFETTYERDYTNGWGDVELFKR